MDSLFKRDLEGELKNWNLFKAYGHFNLCFESIIKNFKDLLIEMVKSSYGFNRDWEDPIYEDVVESHLHDRLLRIILHDDGANAIVEKCRSCFIDISKPEVQKLFKENDIEPFPINEDIKILGEIIFKKASELIKTRNILIHTNFDGVVYAFTSLEKLSGTKDAKTANGFEERNYELTVEYLENIVEQMELFDNYMQSFKCYTLYGANENDTESYNEMMRDFKQMKFTLPKK